MLTISKSVKSYLRIIHLKKKLFRENTIYNFFPLEKIHLIKKKLFELKTFLFDEKKKKKKLSSLIVGFHMMSLKFKLQNYRSC